MRLALVVAVQACLSACFSPDAVSVDVERQMGAEVAREALAQLPLVDDPPVVRFVAELGEHLVRGADTSGRRYEFYVVDSPVANAFAVPGGFIFVNRGILERADNLAEAAGVMAHEIGHVVQRHSLGQMSRARSANTAVGLVYLLLDRRPGVAEQVALEVAGSAWLAKHGRAAEIEADSVGVLYLARARIDPRGMPAFFQKLLQEERRSPSQVEQWFATHPLTADRVAVTESLIRRLPRTALEHGVRDMPQFVNLKARLAALPPSPEPRLPAVP